MLIKILFEIVEGASGGGNHFLKLLRDELVRQNLYTENSDKADCFIFNSHHNIKEVIKLRRKYPKKLFVHRVDGPIFYLRDKDIEIDHLVFMANEYLSDITIFQTAWSREKCRSLGMKIGNNEIIINGTDTSVFYPKTNYSKTDNTVPVFIASSWSNNINKGFDFYKYIDENADFSKFQFLFFGNSPYKFKNIKTYLPVNGTELANKLRKSDYYISASKNDCCSNAVIEALASGLPVLALNSGGNPELLRESGYLFSTKEELLSVINDIINKNIVLKKSETVFSIEEVTSKYVQYIQHNSDKAGTNRFSFSKLIKSMVIYFELTYTVKIKHKFKK